MKFSSFLLCFGMVVTVCGQWDYDKCREDEVGCLENSDEFNKCTAQCEEASPECFNSTAGYFNAADLAICCQSAWRPTENNAAFFSECAEKATLQEFCVTECLPDCVNTGQIDFLMCIVQNIPPMGKCRSEDCLTSLVLTYDIILTGGNQNDLVEEIGEEISDNVGNLGNCDESNALAKDVCEVNGLCCPSCDEELGMLINCVVNNVYRPFIVESDGNDVFSEDDICDEINEKDGEKACENVMDMRRLAKKDMRKLAENTTEPADDSMMTTEEEEEVDPVVLAKQQECQKKFRTTMMYNVTAATSELLKCNAEASVAVLDEVDKSDEEEKEEEKEAPKESAANTSTKSFISAALFVVAAIFA